jgi:hypothetical protein
MGAVLHEIPCLDQALPARVGLHSATWPKNAQTAEVDVEAPEMSSGVQTLGAPDPFRHTPIPAASLTVLRLTTEIYRLASLPVDCLDGTGGPLNPHLNRRRSRIWPLAPEIRAASLRH